MHVISPAAELAARPLPGAVALMTLPEALAAGARARAASMSLPPCACLVKPRLHACMRASERR